MTLLYAGRHKVAIRWVSKPSLYYIHQVAREILRFADNPPAPVGVRKAGNDP